MNDEITETGACSICGRPYEHFGNNPEPLKTFEERCCDACNHEYVIPARIGKPARYLGTWAEYKPQFDAAMAELKRLKDEKAQ